VQQADIVRVYTQLLYGLSSPVCVNYNAFKQYVRTYVLSTSILRNPPKHANLARQDMSHTRIFIALSICAAVRRWPAICVCWQIPQNRRADEVAGTRMGRRCTDVVLFRQLRAEQRWVTTRVVLSLDALCGLLILLVGREQPLWWTMGARLWLLEWWCLWPRTGAMLIPWGGSSLSSPSLLDLEMARLNAPVPLHSTFR
jgi:hypothetical protein